jgi:hypothetical protein
MFAQIGHWLEHDEVACVVLLTSIAVLELFIFSI